MAKQTEKCGRCSASTVVDVAQSGKDEAELRDRDPFADDRIEVDESELSRVSPAVYLARAKARLDAAARRIVYGK